MARAIVRLLPFEMAILGLFELAVIFALSFVMLTEGGQTLLLQSTDLPRDCLVLAGMLAVTIAGTAATIGLYRPDVCLDRRRFLLSGTIAALLAFPAILLVSGAYRVTLSGEHIAWLARLLAIWLLFALLVRFGFSALATHVPVSRPVLIVGDGMRAARLRQRLAAKPHGLFRPIAAPVQVLEDASRAMLVASPAPGRDDQAPSPHPTSFRDARLSPGFVRDRRIWGIVIAEDVPVPDAHGALLDNKLRGIPIYSDLSFQEHHLGRIELEAIDADWLLFSDGFQTGMTSRAFKRVFDIAVGLLLTVVTLPLMLVTALAIKLDSRGPAFYRQERTGLHGETFTLFKFRSMARDAEVAGQPQWAQKRDPRVTRVGAFIRASRIDELPQLFNVLRGEMSMIGPRPERPMFVDELAKVIPFYNHRGYVKPGLTGWAQVNYPYGASVEDAREKLAYDLYYVKNRGVLLDMLILMATVRVILFREGAR
jgi:sugar transferase (PEP-CTERM system associated)